MINFEPSNYPMMESIHIHTNGILWTEQLWNRMNGIHPFVKSCEISIDAATKNTYENEVRIGGDWEVLMKQLKFIVNIPTINHFSFSFVVQDKNYKEMYDFYKLITDLTDEINKSISIFFNHIVNWGTYTEEEFLIRDVANKSNELHSDFLLELQKIHNQKNVSHNFNYLLKKNKFNMKYSMFIGRWKNLLHKGHLWLINQRLKEGKNVCLAIRDVEPNENQPWTAKQIEEMIHEGELKELIQDGRVITTIIPDIESINYGRGVGYEIIEHFPPDEIKEISTSIREQMRKDGKL